MRFEKHEMVWLLSNQAHLIIIVQLQDLEGEREVNRDEVLEYCNASDVNIPLIETSAKVKFEIVWK